MVPKVPKVPQGAHRCLECVLRNGAARNGRLDGDNRATLGARTKRACAVLWTAVLALACSDGRPSPTAPTAAPYPSAPVSVGPDAPFPPPAPPGTSRALSGVVTADGVPASDAKVIPCVAVGWSGGSTIEASARTDGGGMLRDAARARLRRA